MPRRASVGLCKRRVRPVQSNNEAYDTLHGPGSTCGNSGIYRCEGCGSEIASNKGNPFPPQNHHQHQVAQGSIRWKVIVFAQGR